MNVTHLSETHKAAGDYMIRIPRYEVVARILARKFFVWDPAGECNPILHEAEAICFASMAEYLAWRRELAVADPRAAAHLEVVA